MRKRISIDEAQAFAERWLGDGIESIRATGLLKACPRCDRRGWVFIYKFEKQEPRAIIIWDGAARGWQPRAGFEGTGKFADVDTCNPTEVFRPTFGCGHDKARREA